MSSYSEPVSVGGASASPPPSASARSESVSSSSSSGSMTGERVGLEDATGMPPALEPGEPEPALAYMYDTTTSSWASQEMSVTVSPRPFQRGGMRQAFKLVNAANGDVFVGKRYFSREKARDSTYFDDCSMQAYCQLWGASYNGEANIPKHVTFVQTWVLRLLAREGLPIFACEPILVGSFRKLNSNTGWLDSARNTPQAFSHYTYERSGRTLVIVDIQGVEDYYTDPQIHTVEGADFGKGNFGAEGIANFVDTHKCNAICRGLGLPVHGVRPVEEGTQMAWRMLPVALTSTISQQGLALLEEDASCVPSRDVERSLGDAVLDWVYVRDAVKRSGKYHEVPGHFNSHARMLRSDAVAQNRVACKVCA